MRQFLTIKYLKSLTMLVIYSVSLLGYVSAGEIYVGITAEKSSIFIRDSESQDEIAEMEGRFVFSPAFSIRSTDYYFSENSSIGNVLELEAGYYIVNRQIVGGNSVDLKSNLSSIYWDLTPNIFYNFGSKNHDELSIILVP